MSPAHAIPHLIDHLDESIRDALAEGDWRRIVKLAEAAERLDDIGRERR